MSIENDANTICLAIIEEFKNTKKKETFISLVQYLDADFNYPTILFSMEDTEKNQSFIYELIGRLTQEQSALEPSKRRMYLIENAYILK